MVFLGLVFLLIGAGALGWAVYQLYFDPIVDPKIAQKEVSDLRDQWGQQPVDGKPIPGEAMALLRIPKFGDSFEQPVLAGTTQATLKKGLGWFDNTAEPGQVGNFAVAGHRGSKGPLAPIMTLSKGDKVVVETRTNIFTYELTNNPKDITVDKTEVWVLDPVPGHPEATATEPLLTMVTCEDLFHSPDRTISFGKLVDTQVKKQR